MQEHGSSVQCPPPNSTSLQELWVTELKEKKL